MAEEKFDVVVVGAGLAGLAAAYRLAAGGRKVLVLERGHFGGAKNVSGGRIYTYALKDLLGEKWTEAPLEREIRQESIMMMSDVDAVTITASTNSLGDQSYSVLRARLDKWLADQVEAQGGLVIDGALVTGFARENGQICGVLVGDEQVPCDLVIDAEGANAVAAERGGLIDPIKLENMAVSAKYVINLGKDRINERFQLEDGTGLAMLGMGSANKNIFGGLFMYTNKETVSIGIVQDSATWKAHSFQLYDTVEQLKTHPVIGKYIDGGDVVEYTAHLIPEGGAQAINKLYGDGYMVCGDAAGLCINRGFTVRGMDYAIESGIAAAETAEVAFAAGRFDAATLAGYKSRLDAGVMRDFNVTRNGHAYFTSSQHLFTTYPNLLINLMQNLYKVDGSAAVPVKDILKESTRGLSMLSLARDAMKAVKSL